VEKLTRVYKNDISDMQIALAVNWNDTNIEIRCLVTFCCKFGKFIAEKLQHKMTVVCRIDYGKQLLLGIC